jgi:hypothetical protein
MGRWRRAATASAELVAVRPELWVPGALAWTASVGWIPFLVAVARPPSVGELTHLGADLVGSGAWPWNVVLLGAMVVVVGLAAFALTAVGNAVLAAQLGGRPPTRAAVARLLGIALVAAVPASVIGVVLLVGAAIVAPGAFNAPQDEPHPILRMAFRLAPLLVGLALAIVIGAAVAAVAARGAGVRGGPRALGRIGAAGWTQVVVGTLASLGYLVITGLLLRVLYAPIGAALDQGRIGLPASLLLVGFVAIWLCLVAGGGALHAWSATTWSRLVPGDAERGNAERPRPREEPRPA